MVCCMMWNVCGLDGLQCERCDEEEPKMWNGGVKLWCGVEGVEYHGVILNVLWYG